MAKLTFFNDDSELKPKQGEMFILAGMGNAEFIKRALSEGTPGEIAVPKTVADGTMKPEEFIDGTIILALQKRMKPVVVIPLYAVPQTKGIVSDIEAERLLQFSDYERKVRFYDVAEYHDVDVYIQTRAKFFTVASSRDIEQYRNLVRHDSKVMIYQIGRGNFYTDYFSDAGLHTTSDVSNYDGRTLRECIASLQIVMRDDIERGRNAFILVFQVVDSMPGNSPFHSPDNRTIAYTVMATEAYVVYKNIKFEAIFVTVLDPERVAKLKSIAEKYKSPIKTVFERSVAIRDASSEVTGKERESWITLQNAYPDVSFNPVDLTFIDAEETKRMGKERARPISELMAPRKLKGVTSDYIRSLVPNAVNFLNNKRRDRIEKATVRTEKALEKFSSALLANEKVKDAKAEEAVKKVAGRYPLDDLHDFIITADPVAIFAKSTGQDWEETSCEKDGGSHNQGVYSDIEIGNCLVFIVEKEKDHPVARMMLRWCVKDNGDVGFGIERRWYFTVAPGKGSKLDHVAKGELYKGMQAVRATALLVKILHEKGVYDYKLCTTPYRYGGYSDTMQTSNVRIEYKDLMKEYRYVKRIVEGNEQIDVRKMDLSEIVDAINDGEIDIRILPQADLDEIYKKLAYNKDAYIAVNTVQYITSYIGDDDEKMKNLVTIALEAGGEIGRTIKRYLSSRLEHKISSAIQSNDYAALVGWITSDYVQENYRALVQVLSGIFMYAPEDYAMMVPDLSNEYSNNPMVLMSLLGVYDVAGKPELFKKCADRLIALYDKSKIFAKIRNEDARIRETSYCDGNFSTIGLYKICNDSASELFIVKTQESANRLSSGISIVADFSSNAIPKSFHTESAGIAYYGFTRERVNHAVRRMAEYIGMIDPKKLLRYPANPLHVTRKKPKPKLT